MSISLLSMTVHCPFCDYTASQIDTTRERCEEVCSAAMDEHVATQHPPRPGAAA